MQRLPLIADTDAIGGEAIDINNKGQIIGIISTHEPGNGGTAGPTHVALWGPGGGTPGDLGITLNPRRISDEGIIAGSASFNVSSDGASRMWTHACSATGSTPTDLGTLDGLTGSSEALDVNSRGDIVGYSVSTISQHAFLYTGGVMRDLNTLLGFGQCWRLANAASINDSGWIAGFGYPATDPYNVHGFLLTPAVPTSTAITKSVPRSFALYQNYPNPFNPSTTIRYRLAQRSQVTLEAFNILGQHITTLVHETQEAGDHEVKFDGGNLASGVYFYRIHAGDFVQTKKLLLLR
jgi:probable HAF family extracellular repeat protein